jgi:hypothetical protein
MLEARKRGNETEINHEKKIEKQVNKSGLMVDFTRNHKRNIHS